MARLLIILAVSVMLAVAGCSNQRLGYNFLDWWANWELRKYISLDRPQRQMVREQISAMHTWHRETQLPQYADFLEQGLVYLDTDEAVTKEDLQGLVDEALGLWREMMDYAVAPATELLTSLSDDQAKELVSNIRESQTGWLESAGDKPPEKRMQRKLLRWLGTLTEEQILWTTQWANKLQPTGEQRAKTHALWLDELEKLLTQRKANEAFNSGVQRLLLQDHWQYSLEYRKAIDHNRQTTLVYLAMVLNHLTESQEKHLRSEIEDFITDFRRLATR